MKPLANPADKKKAIGLGVAVVLVFLFVVKNTMSAIGGGGQASQEPPVQPISGGGGPPAPSGGGNPSAVIMPSVPGQPVAKKPEDELIVPPTYVAADIPNPFHKDTDHYTGPFDPGEAPPKAPEVIVFKQVPIHQRSQGSLSGTLPHTEGDGGGNKPVVIAEPDTISVSGVMGSGDNAVATIQVGSHAYVVTKGSTFGKNLRLKQVSESQVVIERGGSLQYLRVGARPQPPLPDPAQPPAKQLSGTI